MQVELSLTPLLLLLLLPLPLLQVFDMAEDTAARYHERMEAERRAREEAAKSIVLGLGDGLESFDSDVLAGIADGLNTALTPNSN